MLPTDELRELIRRAQTHDVTAISELYARYAELVVRYLLVRVADPELAQDLTQEVFIKIIGGIARFEYRDEKAFLGWIYTIAANMLHSYQRRQRIVATPLAACSELVDQRSQNDVSMVTERVDLQFAFGQLTYDQQRVLALRFFADLSSSEVAGLLQRSEGAIKSMQYRALRTLQKIMARNVEHGSHQFDPLVGGEKVDSIQVRPPLGAVYNDGQSPAPGQ
jgi:RNA polymerase sigma-70 factor (ECF subfamily)